jgi:ribose 5-phosphate isomerase B
MSEKLKIAIASDLSGFPLRQAIVEHLQENPDIEIIDFGIKDPDHPQPYTAQAPKVAKAIQNGEAEKGIIICGTGQGMAIVANKYKGIYAAVVDSVFSGERSKIINNANVITLGGWITAPFLGVQIVDAWLSMAFTQKMEFKKDFLTENFHKVQTIEEENFK